MDIRRQKAPKPIVFMETEDGGYEETELPTVFEVCPCCEGKGKHVNPNIDGHGISARQFMEDPDFAEDYFSGVFDVPCNYCGGLRVVAVPDESKMTEAQIKAWHEALEDERQMEAEQRAEMAYVDYLETRYDYY